MKISKIIITLGLVAGITFSCNRDENVIATDEVTAQEMVQAEASSEVVTDTTVDLAMDFATTFENTISLRTSSGKHPDYPCATVSVSSTNNTFPKTITIDFGTGCTDKRGNLRKGKLVITLTNPLFLPGASVTINHQDFYVNSKKIEGVITLTNTSVNQTQISFSKQVANGKVTHEDGSYFTFTSSRKWRMIEGLSTPKYIWDDAWEIYEGSKNITRSNGTYFTSAITSALLKKNPCHFISKGKVSMKGSKIDGTLDFGNGECDNIATFTGADGKVKEIQLRK